MMLMEMTPPAEIAAWLACLTFVVVLFNALATAKRNVFGGDKSKTELSPQPLSVREEHDFAREKDCISRAHAAEAAIERIRMERIQDMKDAALSRKNIYQDIKATNAETKAHIESVRKELSEKIDSMPDRVIATLRNFGAIGN